MRRAAAFAIAFAALGALAFFGVRRLRVAATLALASAPPRTIQGPRSEEGSSEFAARTFHAPLPKAYRAESRYGEDDAEGEVALFWPTAASGDLWKEPRRFELGAILVEVFPLSRTQIEDPRLLPRLKSQLEEKGERVRAADGYAYPGLVAEAERPARVSLSLLGRRALYRVTADAPTPAFEQVSRGLREGERP